MIKRYIRPGMGRIWSEDNKYRKWLEVVLAAAHASGAAGFGPDRKGVVELSVYG